MDTKETTTYHAVLIAAVVIGTTIGYFIITIIRQQRMHRLLYKAKIEAEIVTLEKERMRVAADLHDDLGPVLSVVKLKITNIETAGVEDEQLKTEVMQHIDDMLHQVRSIANGLLPGSLKTKGPIEAIEEYIAATLPGTGLKIRMHAAQPLQFPLNSQVHIYRILQEIIHNTIKHAGASTLRIELRMVKNKLIIAAADNGKGFSPCGAAKNNNGMGLNNLRSRAEMLNAEMFIKSEPGKGAQFMFQVPVANV